MTELVVFSSKVMDNMCIVIICLPVYDVIILKLILVSYQAVSLREQKGRDKNLNILSTKKAFSME